MDSLIHGNTLQKLSGNKGGPVAFLEQILPQEKIDLESEIFEKLGAAGGPTHVREWFVDSHEDVDQNDVLYYLVQTQQLIVDQKMKELGIESNDQQRGYCRATIYLASLSQEEKEQLFKIDHILALYLIDVAEQVIVNFYKAVGGFVTLMRSCVNDLAWDKMTNYKLLLDIDSTDSSEHNN